MSARIYRHICIAVVTRDRPKMLANLLSSFSSMCIPEDDYISFLVVENNNCKTLEDVISQFKHRSPLFEVDYILEPVAGISAARNRALEYCISEETDLLAFVDDDEVVSEEWLNNLLIVRDLGRLDIVGSPVRPKPFSADLTLMQNIVWKGVVTLSFSGRKGQGLVDIQAKQAAIFHASKASRRW